MKKYYNIGQLKGAYAAGKRDAELVKGVYAGLFFHTFNGGDFEYQGFVYSENENCIVVDLLSWNSGEVYATQIWEKPTLPTRNIQFYRSNGAMLLAWDKHPKTQELVSNGIYSRDYETGLILGAIGVKGYDIPE